MSLMASCCWPASICRMSSSSCVSLILVLRRFTNSSVSLLIIGGRTRPTVSTSTSAPIWVDVHNYSALRSGHPSTFSHNLLAVRSTRNRIGCCPLDVIDLRCAPRQRRPQGCNRCRRPLATKRSSPSTCPAGRRFLIRSTVAGGQVWRTKNRSECPQSPVTGRRRQLGFTGPSVRQDPHDR